MKESKILKLFSNKFEKHSEKIILYEKIKKIIEDIGYKNDIKLTVKRTHFDPNIHPMSNNNYIYLLIKYKDRDLSDIYIDTETYYIDYQSRCMSILDSKWNFNVKSYLTDGKVFDSLVYEVDNLCKKSKILFDNKICLKTTSEIRNEKINKLL